VSRDGGGGRGATDAGGAAQRVFRFRALARGREIYSGIAVVKTPVLAFTASHDGFAPGAEDAGLRYRISRYSTCDVTFRVSSGKLADGATLFQRALAGPELDDGEHELEWKGELDRDVGGKKKGDFVDPAQGPYKLELVAEQGDKVVASAATSVGVAASLADLEFVLVDHDGTPVAKEPYAVVLPDGKRVSGTTDKAGRAAVKRVRAGECVVSFPKRDGVELDGAPPAAAKWLGQLSVQPGALED
jgi:hypothetical protein